VTPGSAATPTPTPTPTSTPAPTPTPTPTPAPTPTPTPTNPQFQASGVSVRAKVGKGAQASVANFREPNAKPGNFQVTIDWGDQTSPTGGHVRIKGKGKFTASGLHRYTAPGTYAVTVTIVDAAGVRVAAHSTARVGH
jgi:hypothetical protein